MVQLCGEEGQVNDNRVSEYYCFMVYERNHFFLNRQIFSV